MRPEKSELLQKPWVSGERPVAQDRNKSVHLKNG